MHFLFPCIFRRKEWFCTLLSLTFWFLVAILFLKDRFIIQVISKSSDKLNDLFFFKIQTIFIYTKLSTIYFDILTRHKENNLNILAENFSKNKLLIFSGVDIKTNL